MAWKTEFLDTTFQFVVSELDVMNEGTQPVEQTSQANPEGARRPFPVDIVETPEAILVLADLPGVERSRVDVTVNQKDITIIVSPSAEPRDFRHIKKERKSVVGKRVIKLSPEILQGPADASLEDGLLQVVIKKSKNKGRKISIG